MNAEVIVVDDSLTVRMDLADAFSEAGFSVNPCATLAEGRHAVRQSPHAIAILDVLLPDGDGVQLLQEIRDDPATASMVVLLLSNEADVKDRVRGLKTGADEYVGKPYDRGYIVAKARELQNKRIDAVSQVAQPSVLLIDDSLTYREALRQALSASGYRVLLATNGEDGLRMAANERPNALIVDGHMPGMDGATVIRRIRLDAALRGIACLILTGAQDHAAELRALDSGADAFVRKEEDEDIILAKLGVMLRQQKASPQPVRPGLIGPRRILAIDDSASYLQLLAELLRSEGFELVPARTGEEGMQLLSLQSVDCIVLDLKMPGLGGIETCRRIKGVPRLRDIPLIVLTSVDDRASMFEVLGAGADDYISKSGDVEVLKARIRAQIRRKQFEDENRTIREELMHRELDAANERAARELAETRNQFMEELEARNRELEAFSYSVSHDLRAPLRATDGFAHLLDEDYGAQLDEKGRHYLERVLSGTKRMGELIDDLLKLSRVSRGELRRAPVDMSALSRAVLTELRARSPDREVAVRVAEGLSLNGDEGLLRVVLENLLGNAWKFTSKTVSAQIDVGMTDSVFFVRDNGAGFSMAYADKLFGPFQRLHSEAEFEGTGIGLATVKRIVVRHGGKVWAESEPGRGTSLYFSLG